VNGKKENPETTFMSEFMITCLSLQAKYRDKTLVGENCSPWW